MQLAQPFTATVGIKKRYFATFKAIIDLVFENSRDESIEEKIWNIKKRLTEALPPLVSEYYCNGIDNCLK